MGNHDVGLSSERGLSWTECLGLGRRGEEVELKSSATPPPPRWKPILSVNQAIELAREAALAERWPWEEPIHAVSRRRGWLGTGARYWEIVSNARSVGNNVSIAIDDESGRVIGHRLLAPAAGDRAPHVTEFAAIEIAQKVAAERGWPWEEPILAIGRRRGWFWSGPRYWEVFSNSNCSGRNVSVAIDYTTGRVLGSGFNPR